MAKSVSLPAAQFRHLDKPQGSSLPSSREAARKHPPLLLGSCWGSWPGPGESKPVSVEYLYAFGEQVLCRSDVKIILFLSIRASHKYYFRRADVRQTSIFIRSETARRYIYSGLGPRSALVAGMPKMLKNRSVGWASKLNLPM